MINVQLISISSTWMNTLPMTLSLMEEYSKTDPKLSDVNFLPYIFHTHQKSVLDFMPSETIDVAGATLYIWNANRSLKLLREIKANNPNCTTIVGGGNAPYYDKEAEQFLREHPYIDFIIHKEGEDPLRQILLFKKNLLEITEIDSISYLHNNHYKRNKLAIFKSLDTPSPFKNKNFLRCMDQVDELGLLRGTVWETNRGCPYSCSFCDWGGLVSQKIRQVPDQRLFAEMEFLVQNMDEIFFGDANFGIFPRDVEITKKIVNLYETLDNPRLKVMHTGNAKNTTDRVYEIGKLLNKYNLQRSGVSLSLQTYTDEALANVKRTNIQKEKYQELTSKFIGDGVPVYTDMIINLPGETFSSFLDSLEIVLQGDVTDIRTFLLEMYPNSAISQEVEKFKIKTRKNLILRGVTEDENEYTEQVYETYSMKYEDAERLRRLTIFIDILHQGKYLYYIAKYLKNMHQIRFVDFYLDLFKKTKGFISDIANNDRILDRYNNGIDIEATGKTPFDIKWGNTFRKQQFIWTVISENKKIFYEEIQQYLKKYNDVALEDLILYQNDLMISADFDPDTGKIQNYKYNWYDYFNNNKILKQEQNKLFFYDTHIGTLSEQIPLKDPSIFMKYAAGGRSYFTQRQGSYIHQSIKQL